MMKSKLPFFLLLILATFSCNQDQSVLDGIKGTWKIQSRILDGVAVPEKDLSGLQYNFEPCKVGEGNCDGTIKRIKAKARSLLT